MSNITIELPNHNTIIIADNDRRGARGQLDAADTVVINGQVFNPAGSANQAGSSEWNYLLRVLQVPSLAGRSLPDSANIFRSRELAFEQANLGNCETSDEILRSSNTQADNHRMPMMSYHDLGLLHSILPNVPTPPDGGIAYLATIDRGLATFCSNRPRGGFRITERMEMSRPISQENLRKFIQEMTLPHR